MKTFKNLTVATDENLEAKLSELLPGWTSYRIIKKSIDARRKAKPHWVISVDVFENDEIPESLELERLNVTLKNEDRPVIVGAGPAGLFCALRLVERGIPCLLLERGSSAEKRIVAINRFWRYGELDEDDNVCFGEGGAGLYSDGKLITRIKSDHIPYVMDRLVRFGAPEEIKYLSNPHVGSDRIRRVIPLMRRFLIEHGCEIQFNAKVEELLVEDGRVSGVKMAGGLAIRSPHVVLATGHSSTDFFYRLRDQGIFMEGKSFSIGLRVEHPQSLINQIQYREVAEDLGAANYKLTYQDQLTGEGVYSFCMCPGGYVLSSTTDRGRTVANGMSNYRRNSPFANSAVVVTVDQEKHFNNELLGGLDLRSRIESDAYEMSQRYGTGKELPGQGLLDYMLGRESKTLKKTSSLSGAVPAPLHRLLPERLRVELLNAFESFDTKMKGFLSPDAQVFGVETRTSCPVRITRDRESFQSISHQGLYPCGEGAGYAGGITSAAVDGIKIAEKIAESFQGA